MSLPKQIQAGIENAETPAIELALTQALLTQQIERDALKAAIDVHVRAVHDMAVTTAIHGTVNHQAELYVIAQEENCALWRQAGLRPNPLFS